MTISPRPATPAQVAMYGHVAAKLRAFLAEKNMKVRDLNLAMSRPPSFTPTYSWVQAKGAPGKKLRPLVSRVTGIPVRDLISRRIGDAPVEPEVLRPVPQPRATGNAGPSHVLAFTVDNEGAARIRVEITLTAVQGVNLLPLLLDAGLVMRDE